RALAYVLFLEKQVPGKCFSMAPVPESASKAVKLWMQSLAAKLFWNEQEKDLIPMVQFLLRDLPQQRLPSALVTAYLLYRAKCVVPPLASEPLHVTSWGDGKVFPLKHIQCDVSKI
ncbi:unnamed protein product, partial [Cladocopium goreaui]